MDRAELRARTAWGLIARPADPLAWHLLNALGPEESLSFIIGPGSLGQVAKALERHTAGLRIPHESLVSYRERYRVERVDRAMALAEKAGIVAISSTHPWWPEALGDLQSHAPTTLWVQGSLHQSSLGSAIAVVGTQRPTPAGRSNTRALVDVAFGLGLGIISGGTRGISTEAHRGAVAAGGISIAVLAGGLESHYPSENARLFHALCRRGALVSEVPCTVSPSVEGFLWRNRIIAALAEATVLVEAEYRCGAISVGYQAAALGRHLGIVPQAWGDGRGAGCWRIYRECGAIVVTEPADVCLLGRGTGQPVLVEGTRGSYDQF